MEFEVLGAWNTCLTIRNFIDGRDWSYGITYRNGRRVLGEWMKVRASIDDALPTIDEAIPPFRFACEEARRRGLVD